MKLKDICSFQSGGTPSKSNPAFFHGTIPWITTVALNGKTINEKAAVEWITEQAVSESAAKIVPAYSIMVGTRVGVGKTAINSVPMATSQDIISLIGIDETVWNISYVNKLIQSKSAFLNSQARGATIKGIKIEALADITINEISMEEQDSIVLTLDNVQKIIDTRRRELANLDDLIKARFVEMFVGKNYPIVELDKVSLGKGEYGAQSASVEYNESRPRYVRITDINDDGTLNNDLVCSANVSDDLEYKLEYGDFCFARMGATVGKTYAFKEGNQIYAGYLIRYKLNMNLIKPEYLYAYTTLDEYKSWVLLNQSGAAQPGINAKKYSSLQMPLAPINEQVSFVEFCNQLDKSKFAVQKALEKAQLLFDSLMQQYFG